jgi:hypothetical protein
MIGRWVRPLLLLALATTSAATTGCSVVDFGGRPDDDAGDDTPSFVAALTACRGKTVTVPPGLWRLDSTVQIGNTSLTPARNRTCEGSFMPFASCARPPLTTELYLQHGAHLRRLAAHSPDIGPVVSVVQFGCRLHGRGGVVESENPSPRGVVHLGPSSPFIPGAIQFASISGIRITGQYTCDPDALQRPGEASDNCIARKNFSSTIYQNAAWNSTPATSGYEQCGYGFCSCCPKTPGGPIAAECPPIYHEALHSSPHPFHKLDCGHCNKLTFLGNRSWPGFQQNASFGRDGSVGLCVDSSEPVTTGATYQNTVRDLIITGVDVGMYAASQVNANEFDNLQFVAVGSASYWFEINSENTIVGGFTGGSFPGIPWPIFNGEGTKGKPWNEFVGIKGVQSYTNFFIGVQGEPGRGKYFELDNLCYENNIFGHNNWDEGPTSEDPFLVYINSGSVSSFAGIDTKKLTASSVTCQGGTKNVTDLCAAADEDQQEQHEQANMKQELTELRAEVTRLGELVQALSQRL